MEFRAHQKIKFLDLSNVSILDHDIKTIIKTNKRATYNYQHKIRRGGNNIDTSFM